MTDGDTLHVDLIVGPQPRRLLVLLHGHGSDENAMRPWPSQLDPAGCYSIALVRAPHRTAWGQAWFDLGDMAMMVEQLDTSLRMLTDTHEALVDRLAITLDETVVCGFSQGGAVALALGLARSQRARPLGVMAFCGWLPDDLNIDCDWDVPDLPPVFFASGTEDPRVTISQARATVVGLRRRGVQLSAVEHDIGHDVHPQAIELSRRWLDQLPWRGSAPTKQDE